jgi:hypothetical protein
MRTRSIGRPVELLDGEAGADDGQVEGGGDDIGVWATNNIDEAGGGLIFSVNEVAKEFSDWGDGSLTDARTSMTDDGAEEARDCIGNA